MSDLATLARPTAMMKILPASHLDHGLTTEHRTWLRHHCAERTAFFVETLTLPDHLPALECGLYGPAMGDPDVAEADVSYALRPGRKCASRLVALPPRPTRQITIIAGPSGEEPCVLYTSYGGPAAPREPGDTALPDWEAVTTARTFWAVHALAESPRERGLRVIHAIRAERE